jgi:LysM repeat protein
MKASKIFSLFIGICLFQVSFGNAVYLEYDQSCMDRYEYRYKGVEFGASHIVYHLRQNNNEKVVLEVGIESKIDYEIKPRNLKTCRDISLNERMVRDVNNGDVQLFIVKRSGKGYNVSPVGIATYSQITPQGFAFVTLDNMFSYKYNQPANGTNLAKKDSEAKVFYNGTLSHNCPRKYLFTKTKSKAGRNYTEYTIIPEIGILEEKTGFNQTDAANNVLELVAINGLPIESYLKDYCRGKDLNYVYSGTFYSNRTGIAASKPYRGSTMADLERGRNSRPGTKTNEGSSSTDNSSSTASTGVPKSTSFNCPVYKDIDRGLYIDRNTGNPANLSCGGNNYRNGRMVNSPIPNNNLAGDTASSNVVNVNPGPSTDGYDYCLEQSSDGIHVVQPSETLYGIAQMYNLSVEEIRGFNKLKDDRIFPCMKIKTKTKFSAKVNDELVSKEAPEFLIHVVAPGETIYQIASKYGYTVDKFKEINGLESNFISVGQKLRISNCNCPTPTSKPETFTVVENDIPDSFESTAERRLIVDNNQKRKVHIVRENETIYVIAKQYDLSVAKLRELNNLEVNEVIIPYQRLYIN